MEVRMEEEELLKKRFRELAGKCYQNNQYTFTGFLSLAELSCFYEMEGELSYVPWKVWGGGEFCERAMIRFGSPQELGYEEAFPIACIGAKPLAAKFADALTHRDFLGALMNLGIERSTLGDIFIVNQTGYFFCGENMADFIIENLTRVKHTSVLCSREEKVPELTRPEMQEMRVQIASERIDGVLSKVCRLSRNEGAALFGQKKVFVNGRLCENGSRSLKSGDVVTLRGWGKFVYSGSQGVSKKGKINALILYYGKGR